MKIKTISGVFAMRSLFLFFVILGINTALFAQEFNAKVEVMHDKILNTDPKVFQALKKNLTDFINTRKWTNDNFKPVEKIDCSFMLNITEKLSENGNKYKATLNVQSLRPVYNSTYITNLINYIDREVIFEFEESQVLLYDDNRVSSGQNPYISNLTAIVAYYCYLILGFDYDSYALNGGEQYLKKALNIVNNAPEDGANIKGWKANEGTRNRYWIIDQILNPRFDGFRPYIYTYHLKGLDMMSQKPEEGLKNILDGLSKLSEIHKTNPSSILMQFFFSAKSNEYISLLRGNTIEKKEEYISQLTKLDVPNTSKYRTIK